MKKIISLFIICIALISAIHSTVHSAIAVTSLHPKFGTQLRIVNHWRDTVHVREGNIIIKESDVSSEQTLDWTMYSTVITNLSLTYWKEGGWQVIPGCVNGNYYSNLTVKIVAAPWDSSVPICHII